MVFPPASAPVAAADAATQTKGQQASSPTPTQAPTVQQTEPPTAAPAIQRFPNPVSFTLLPSPLPGIIVPFAHGTQAPTAQQTLFVPVAGYPGPTSVPTSSTSKGALNSTTVAHTPATTQQPIVNAANGNSERAPVTNAAAQTAVPTVYVHAAPTVPQASATKPAQTPAPTVK